MFPMARVRTHDSSLSVKDQSINNKSTDAVLLAWMLSDKTQEEQCYILRLVKKTNHSFPLKITQI